MLNCFQIFMAVCQIIMVLANLLWCHPGESLKGSAGGSRSMERFKHTANLLTIVQICRRQKRSVIDFFEQAIIALVSSSQQAPSLIPQS